MVSKYNIRVPISGMPQGPADLSMSASVYLPDAAKDACKASIVFAFPGGGYSRDYYDIQIQHRTGYSLARHLASCGHVVITCDHVQANRSRNPKGAEVLTTDIRIAANHVAIQSTLSQLRTGELIEDIPSIRPILTIGLGHSMGAGFLAFQQARYHTFDAVALLGCTVPATSISRVRTAVALSRDLHNIMRARAMLLEVQKEQTSISNDIRQMYEPFINSGVPDDVVRADLGVTEIPSEATRKIARILARRSCVALLYRVLELNVTVAHYKNLYKAAEAIEVPLFLCYGDRDVSLNSHREPSSYKNSPDITLFIVRRSSHCLNFSSSRQVLFDRINSWIDAISSPKI